jgi:transposase
VQALTGRFDEHHGELARILLDQIDRLDTQITQLTGRIEGLVSQIGGTATPPSDPVGDDSCPPPSPGPGRSPAADAVRRVSQIPGLSPETAQLIVGEIGLDMTRFPTAAHQVSWAKLRPRTVQSEASSSTGKIGKGNPYLKGVLGLAAATAARSGGTFLAERYRRIVKRRGKNKALVAVARSILVIIWHLLADPTTTYHDLGPDYYDKRINTNRKVNSLIRQLEALGHTVTLQPAA